MRPNWHPISAVLLNDPPVMAGAAALRLLLRAGPITLRYAGDRMAPAVRHGQVVRVHSPTGGGGRKSLPRAAWSSPRSNRFRIFFA